MKRLYLVRHGESIQNVGINQELRMPDHAIYLTEKGMQQASNAGKFIAQHLDGVPSSNIVMWVSPYKRTRETAGAILKHINVSKVKEDDMLTELQFGMLGYTQSDEISLLLVDYQTLTTDSWFDDTVQKMCSISASMATLVFNKAWKEVVDEWGEKTFGSSWFEGGTNEPIDELLKKKADTYCSKYDRALFDSRVFNVPKEDVANYFVWRQQDATRNSIQSAGQACFSHRELMNKTCNMIQDMLFTEKGINWNDYSTSCKRGTCCVKRMVDVPTGNVCGAVQEVVRRQKWQLDTGIPIFTQEPNYVNSLVFVGD